MTGFIDIGQRPEPHIIPTWRTPADEVARLVQTLDGINHDPEHLHDLTMLPNAAQWTSWRERT